MASFQSGLLGDSPQRELESGGALSWHQVKDFCCVAASRNARGGFRQAGNACYLAAALQFLFNAPSLDVASFQCSCSSPTCLSCMLQHGEATSRRPSLAASLQSWEKLVRSLNLQWGRLHDTSEFLKKAIAAWADTDSVACLADYRRFREAFEMPSSLWIRKFASCSCQSSSHRHCVEHSVNARDDPELFLMPSIAVDGSPTAMQELLSSCWAEVRVEPHTTDKCLLCESPWEIIHQHQLQGIAPTPMIACLLSRVELDVETQLLVKNSKVIHLDRVIRVNDVLFTLSLFVVHIGISCEAGHYITWVRSGSLWHVFDDAAVYDFRGMHLPEFVHQSATLVLYQQAPWLLTLVSILRQRDLLQESLLSLLPPPFRFALLATASLCVQQSSHGDARAATRPAGTFASSEAVPSVPNHDSMISSMQDARIEIGVTIDNAPQDVPDLDSHASVASGDDEPDCDDGFEGEMQLEDDGCLPRDCSLTSFVAHVNQLLDTFASDQSEKAALEFLQMLPDMSPFTTRVGPHALLNRLHDGLTTIRDSNMGSAEAIHTTIPYWECHNYVVCVMCEALSRVWGLPGTFYLDAFRSAMMSLIHKDAHVNTSGFNVKHRPWSCGVGDAGTGKSHPADKFLDIVEGVCQEEQSYAIGEPDDNFHVVFTRTYSAMEDKMRDTDGYALLLCGEGSHQLCKSFPAKGEWDDAKGLPFNRMMDTATGKQFGGETKHDRSKKKSCTTPKRFSAARSPHEEHEPRTRAFHSGYCVRRLVGIVGKQGK